MSKPKLSPDERARASVMLELLIEGERFEDFCFRFVALERENAELRERLAAAEDLLVGVMAEGVEYHSSKYAHVQMSHELRDDIRKFNAARALIAQIEGRKE